MVDRLNYPTLEMLRATCKTLGEDILNEKQIHKVFMVPRRDLVFYIEPDDNDWTVYRDCLKYCDLNTPGIEHATASKPKCSLCAREYVAVLRPGAFVILPEGCECEFYDCCGRSDEACGPLGICKACYGLKGKQRSVKAKPKAFGGKYGAWLCLQPLDGAGRSLKKRYGSESEGVF